MQAYFQAIWFAIFVQIKTQIVAHIFMSFKRMRCIRLVRTNSLHNV